MAKLSADQIEILTDFVQESRDMIEQLEPTIIELEQNKDDPEVINSIFRLFHSMKGGAGFLNLDNIAHTAHAAENLLDLIRSRQIELLPAHIDLLCQTCDFFKEAMDYAETNLEDAGMAKKGNALSSKLQHSIKDAEGTEGPGGKEEKPAGTVEPESVKEEIPPKMELNISSEMVQRFVQEQADLLQEFEQGLLKWIDSPDDIESVRGVFRNIHSFKGNCGFYGFADLERLSHQMETVMDAARSGAVLVSEKPKETLLQLLDVLRERLGEISQGGEGGIKGLAMLLEMLERILPKGWVSDETPVLEKSRIGGILVKEGSISCSDLESALDVQKRTVGEILVEKGITTTDRIDDALKKQEEIRPIPELKPAFQKTVIKRQDIRVNLDKLDTLINLIGEMVIAENMLTHNPDLEGLELESFNKAAQQMNKIVRDLQEMAMNIRMIPISGLLRRMIRLVHDLAGKSGKKVQLLLSGEETEVDKTVIELITDPLVHLIRNSLDHGLEPPADRLSAGKPGTGMVKLTAMHQQGEVRIIVEDDGRGLDRDKILAKARTMGLIDDDGSSMSDQAVFALVFEPGFSTAAAVTDVSGRGVGMDVVRKNLEKIKGKIDIFSKKGEGTKVVLRIPLTLAIIDGMMVRVGDSKYILPILLIKESFRPLPQAITLSPDGQELVRVREELMPVVRLHELHNKKPDSDKLHEGILMVMEFQGMNVCLFVDEIIGQQQTVIKGLSGYIGNVRGVSGCTILGNGDICLILDMGSLIELAGKG